MFEMDFHFWDSNSNAVLAEKGKSYRKLKSVKKEFKTSKREYMMPPEMLRTMYPLRLGYTEHRKS